MADEKDIVYKVNVETSGSEKSLSELRQEFKQFDAQLGNAKKGTKEFTDALKGLGETRGQITQLKNQIDALNPEARGRAIAQMSSALAGGFQAATGAAALFGAKAEDVQKVLLRVQAATALAQGIQEVTQLGGAFSQLRLILLANPILIIAGIIISIGVALYELRDKIKIVGEAFDFLGKGLSWIVEKGKEMLDYMGLYDLEADRQIEANKKLQESFDKLTKEGDRYINLLKAHGKETFEIEQGNLQKRIALINAEIANKKAFTNLSKDEQDKLLKLQYDLNTQLEILNATRLKTQEDKDKQAWEKRKKLLLDEEELRKQINLNIYNGYLEGAKLDAEDKKSKEDAALKAMQDSDALEQKKLQKSREQAEQEILLAKLVNDAKFNLAFQSLGAVNDLTQAFAGKNEAGAKRAFEFNKAVSIAQASMSTYQSANAIFKSAAESPITIAFPAYPYVQAGLAVAAGIANVTKIARTQFNSAPASGGSIPSPGGGSANAPQIAPPQQQVSNVTTQTQTNKQGEFTRFGNVRAYVVETELTENQNRIKKIENNAKY